MTADEEGPAIETIILAFAADPVTRWTWPHPYQYMAAMPKFVQAFGGGAFAHGGAYCTNEYAGAALWLPPGVHPDEDRLGELMRSTASPSARGEAPAIFRQMAKYHPSEPHWYLPLIGVDPAHQGKGHGDALMVYALERCDRDKLPAYSGIHKSTKRFLVLPPRLRTSWHDTGRFVAANRAHVARFALEIGLNAVRPEHADRGGQEVILNISCG